jgi:hypothetical protein
MTKRDVSDVNAMSWPQLNDALVKCEDVVKLGRWLKATMQGGGTLYRALRIHGRLTAVRRVQELAAIHTELGGRPKRVKITAGTVAGEPIDKEAA